GELIGIRTYSTFEDPFSAVVDLDATIYFTDAMMSEQHGKVWRIKRPGGPMGGHTPPEILASSSRLDFPYGLDLTSDGTLLICDESGRGLFASGDHGAIFHLIYGLSGELDSLMTYGIPHEELVDPQRLAIYHPTDPQIISLTVEDITGGNLVPGDTLIARAELQNNSPTPTLGIAAVLQYSLLLDLLDAEAERGDLFIGEETHLLHWSGNLEYGNPLEITALLRVDTLATQGQMAEFSVGFQGGGTPDPETTSLMITAPLSGGEIVVLDAAFEADSTAGAILVLDRAAQQMSVYRLSDLFVHPVDILPVSCKRFLVLDSEADPLDLGGETGALLDLDLEGDADSVLLAGDFFVSPQRLLPNPQGGWAILDPGALPSGDARGALYAVSEDWEIEILCYSPEFRALTDMAFDSQGRLWLSDMEATAPGGSAGIIFLCEYNAGSRRYEIVEFFDEEIVEPQGLLWQPGWGGLLFTDTGWHYQADDLWVRRLNPEMGNIGLVASCDELRAPGRMLWLSEREVLIVDPEAPPLAGGGEGVIFQLDPTQYNNLTALASYADAVELISLNTVPGPETRIVFFTAQEDSSGRWAQRGETLHCTICLANSAQEAEPWASLTVELSEQLLLDVASVETSRGEVTVCGDVLSWEGPVAAGDTVTIVYNVSIRSTPGLSSWADQWANLEVQRGVSSEAQLTYYISSAVGAGELLILDASANPRERDYLTGAVFRIEGPLREVVPILAGSLFVSPSDIDRIPGSETDFLIVDSDTETGTGEYGGALLRASTETGQIEILFCDTTLVHPRAVVVRDSTTCYLLDQIADPFNLSPEQFGPGAIYEIDLASGTGAALFSDSCLSSPYDLTSGPDGMLYLLDRTIGGAFPYGGGVIAIDPSDGSHRIVRQGSPFRSPRALTFAPNGRLLVVDAGEPGAEMGVLYSL
ncbi:MAG: hypothetical protein KAY24_05700, partial [Candidatus Eisenbacteria sp.]|nr:hypothetical protein [Candidatus Eisenbacteria bacterium]